ncbi:hypothetical protein DSCA_16870 [Desulfosarcina alkanivorans]|uniref:Uncharacterized protein n=1 Tax=Desulfosarcina alkanivorans TaxID=571177 RepID=A0A5K7YSZ0_9BACT|nr:hypothetical protein DSCA_16870 [Desulfosarcina alkanivorans]
MLNRRRLLMAHRWEPVDLIPAFCYGSVEPEPAGKSGWHELAPDAGSLIRPTQWGRPGLTGPETR